MYIERHEGLAEQSRETAKHRSRNAFGACGPGLFRSATTGVFCAEDGGMRSGLRGDLVLGVSDFRFGGAA